MYPKYEQSFSINFTEYKDGKESRHLTLSEEGVGDETWHDLLQVVLQAFRGWGYVINPDTFYEAFDQMAQETYDAEKTDGRSEFGQRFVATDEE